MNITAGDLHYAGATLPLLEALPPVLDAPPLALLAWTATRYLRCYLTAGEYRAASSAALDRARAEADAWPPALPSVGRERDLEPLSADRQALYRALWSRAIAGGSAAHLLLAQHACEIAELLEPEQLPTALRLAAVLTMASEPGVLSQAPDADQALEQLSRAMLSRKIRPDTFIAHLLLLHAGNRGAELTGGWSAPREQAVRLVGALPASDRSPRRLRAVQGFELARRAVASGSALVTLAVEAGLAEAEQLANGQRLLLLAALDRATTPNENRHDRS